MAELPNSELLDSCSVGNNFTGRERKNPVNARSLGQAKREISNANWSKIGIAYPIHRGQQRQGQQQMQGQRQQRMPVQGQQQRGQMQQAPEKKPVKQKINWEKVSFQAPHAKFPLELKSNFSETPDNKSGGVSVAKTLGILLFFGLLGYYIYVKTNKKSSK